MKIISAYSGLIEYPIQKVSTHFFTNIKGEAKTAQFMYNIPFPNHFKYCHTFDEHNNLRHSKISLEETWSTQRWPNIVSPLFWTFQR